MIMRTLYKIANDEFLSWMFCACFWLVPMILIASELITDPLFYVIGGALSTGMMITIFELQNSYPSRKEEP